MNCLPQGIVVIKKGEHIFSPIKKMQTIIVKGDACVTLSQCYFPLTVYCCERAVVDVESCHARSTTVKCSDKARVYLRGHDVRVFSYKNSYVEVREGNHDIDAFNRSLVLSQRNTCVAAHDRARVIAKEDTHVVLYDESIGEICDGVNAFATDTARVIAKGSAFVKARGKSKIYAYDGVSVIATDISNVWAYDDVSVDVYGHARVWGYRNQVKDVLE